MLLPWIIKPYVTNGASQAAAEVAVGHRHFTVVLSLQLPTYRWSIYERNIDDPFDFIDRMIHEDVGRSPVLSSISMKLLLTELLAEAELRILTPMDLLSRGL